MSTFKTAMIPAATHIAFRKPVRITITVSHHTHLALTERCDQEGRSLSNLAAYMLENSLKNP